MFKKKEESNGDKESNSDILQIFRSNQYIEHYKGQ